MLVYLNEIAQHTRYRIKIECNQALFYIGSLPFFNPLPPKALILLLYDAFSISVNWNFFNKPDFCSQLVVHRVCLSFNLNVKFLELFTSNAFHMSDTVFS